MLDMVQRKKEFDAAVAAASANLDGLLAAGWQCTGESTKTTQMGWMAMMQLAGKRSAEHDSSAGSTPTKRRVIERMQTPPSRTSPGISRLECDNEVPPTDLEIARVYAELESMHQEVAGVDIQHVLHGVLRVTSKHNLVEQHGATYLAYNKCLLLQAFEGRRSLGLKTGHGGMLLRKVVEKWEEEIRDGASIYVPKIKRNNEVACRLLACVVELSQHLSPDDEARTCEPTWTHNFIAPYMSLIADAELTVKYDSTTAYSVKRPDVQIVSGNRVITCVEIKHKWAKQTDMKKDQSRVIKSAMHYISHDASTFELAANPVRLALWCAGEEVFVYEVVGYPSGLFIAVEIARFCLPTSIRPGTVSLVADAIGWFSAVAERVQHVKRRMHADVARPGRSFGGGDNEEEEF
ncbi:hypothetical protein HDU87_002638 [Geranomyces variabilis]|uniref:Uncharacterized protein n=1 Tax=Geranomyces variabilis TaxID=109894 RepID=A0AAD5TRI3_9FUNG|nr:hypothetical protein HDU87_002638 [Geranomyces variabilis]